MKLIIILLFLTTTAKAQFISKKDVPVYACMFGSGLFYGQAEKLIWKPVNNQFWNPYMNWQKTNGDLIKLDGYHLMRLGQFTCITGAVVLSVNDFHGKGKFWQISKKVLLCSASFWIGQEVTYKLIK